MRILCKSLWLLIALLALLLSAGCGDSPGKVDENIKNIQLETRKFTKDNTTVVLPEITGMKNERLQKKINDNLKEAILKLERKGEKSGLEGEYGIVFLNDRLLVIAFEGQNLVEDENGNTSIIKGIHIDLTSGKIYEPTEIFKKGSPYEEEILNLAQSLPDLRLYAPDNENWSYGLFKSNWDSQKKNQFYMLTEDYLWVYTFSVAEEGIVPGYGIPYDRMKHLLDSDSDLWKALGSGENRAEAFDGYITLPEYQVAVDERNAREAANQQMQAMKVAAAKKAVKPKKPAITWKTTKVVNNQDGSITINGQYTNTTDKTMTKTNWNKLTIYYKTASGAEKSFVKTFDKAIEKEAPPGTTVAAWFKVNVPGDYQSFIRVSHQFNYSYTYSN